MNDEQAMKLWGFFQQVNEWDLEDDDEDEGDE